MRSIVVGECLGLLCAQFLYGAPANTLMGADFAGTVLRMVLLRASYRYSNYLTLTSTGEDPMVGGPGDSGSPIFTYRGMHALAGIIVGGKPDFAIAVKIAPNYTWIKETMEKLGGSQETAPYSTPASSGVN
jgi:hypothetical protein